MKKVTATEIANYVYCPEAWRLKHGLGLKDGNVAAKAAGVSRHESWQVAERRSTWLIKLAFVALIGAIALVVLSELL